MVGQIDKQAVKSFLLDLQERICAECEALDTAAQFVEDSWQRTEGGGEAALHLLSAGTASAGFRASAAACGVMILSCARLGPL